MRQAIRSLKLGKASILDEICGEFLKYAEHVVAPLLTKLFDKLYDTSYFPVYWCKYSIVPLFKKGDEHNPDNYRGLSLLSTDSEVFTAILINDCIHGQKKRLRGAKNQQAFARDILL